MILPIGDAPNPRGVPYVTYLLIAINVAIYVLITWPLGALRPDPSDPALREYLYIMSEAQGHRVPLQYLLNQVSAYDLFVFTHGWRPVAPSVQNLFFSMFLHGGFLHLFGNMLFLWIYGDNVEHRLGSVKYVLAYLATGIGATLFQTALSPSSPVPMIGASGAISGVLGFYFVWFPRNHVRLLWFFPPFFMQVFEISARIVLGFYLIADNLLPLFLTRAQSGVAHGAHIGGFITGLAAAWILDRHFLNERPREYRSAVTPDHATAGSDLIARAIDREDFEKAAKEYFSLPSSMSHRILSPSHSMALANWLRSNGHGEAALVLLRRQMRDYPNGPLLAEAYLSAGEILLAKMGQPTTAYQYFLAALDLNPSPDIAKTAQKNIASIESLQKRRYSGS